MADDADRAWAEAAPGIAYLEGQITSYSDGPDAPGAALRRDDYLVGTPAHVAERLVALHPELRFVHFAHWARLPGLSHQRALESLRLFATEVVPLVLSALGQAPE